MLFSPSEKFMFNDETSNLFLFYQCINELTFDYSPDSYKSPVHNTRTLCKEALVTFYRLKQDKLIDSFYSKYVVPIIEELSDNLLSDDIAKELLGEKYDAYIGFLNEAAQTHGATAFEKHMNNLILQLDSSSYFALLVSRITSYVKTNENSNDIFHYSSSLVCELIEKGYSKQHIFQTAKYFFGTQAVKNSSAVDKFFNSFNNEKMEWELLLILPETLFTLYGKDIEQFLFEDRVSSFVEVTGEEWQAIVDGLPKRSKPYLYFDKLFDSQNAIDSPHKIAKITIKDYDPYKADIEIHRQLTLFQNCILWFEHDKCKVIDSSLEALCQNYKFASLIRFRKPMSRYFSDAEPGQVDRVRLILTSDFKSKDTLLKLINVFQLHADAYIPNQKEENTLLTLWTIMEVLFTNNTVQVNKASQVFNGMLDIIQRTYILKSIKYIQRDLLKTLAETEQTALIKKYTLEDTRSFINALYDIPSGSSNEICDALEKNPLLRKRIAVFVDKDFRKGASIIEILAKHKTKIERQILRIYRARNFIIHGNYDIQNVDMYVEHLHNYLDFFVNYIVCKLESEKPVLRIMDIVSEVEMDNSMHMNYLTKNKKTRTKDDPLKMLFGANQDIIDIYEGKSICQ